MSDRGVEQSRRTFLGQPTALLEPADREDTGTRERRINR